MFDWRQIVSQGVQYIAARPLVLSEWNEVLHFKMEGGGAEPDESLIPAGCKRVSVFCRDETVET